MGIKFTCPQCQKKLNVKSFLAGKRGKCPYCQAGIDIPSAAEEDTGGEIGGSAPRMGAPASTAAATPATTAPTPTVVPAAAVAPAAAPGSSASTPLAAAKTAAPTAAAPTPGAAQPVMPAASVQPVVGQAVVVGAPATHPLPVGAAPVSVGGTLPVGVAAVVPQPVATLPDPFAEAPNAVWYVRPPSGGQYGPAKSDALRRWIDENRVTADSLVWREGWPDWRMAHTVFPRFAVVPAPSPMSGPMPALPMGMAAGTMPVGAAVGASGPAMIPPVDPGPTTASGKPIYYRRRSSAGALVAIIFLSLALIVLIPVLIFVLKRGF